MSKRNTTEPQMGSNPLPTGERVDLFDETFTLTAGLSDEYAAMVGAAFRLGYRVELTKDADSDFVRFFAVKP